MSVASTQKAHRAPLLFKSPEDGFLGLSAEEAVSPADAKAWVIPFGFEESVTYGGGTSKGPEAILEASHQVEQFDELFWCEPFREYGVATVDYAAEQSDIPSALDRLEALVEETLTQGKFPMVLGGEHSITAGAIRPFARRYEDLTILQFDAHADLRDGYLGEHYSHASAMRRCLDHANIRLVSVGIRNISAGEVPYLESSGDRISIFWAKDKKKWTAEDVAKAVGSGNVYVTFDLDGFDSSLMAATGTPEPGGIFWDDAMDVLQAVSANAKIVGADVVELAPAEGLHACDFLAARLCYRMLSFALK